MAMSVLSRAPTFSLPLQRSTRSTVTSRTIPTVCRPSILVNGVTVAPRSLRSSDIKCRSAAVGTPTNTGDLQLLDTSTFYQYLEDAGEALVVIDFYTEWCGPCKVIYPELVKLAKERPEIRIAKFNCNKANKDLGVKLGIKVAPTFHIYKKSVKVSEMTGAKMEQLVALIDKALEPEETA